MNHFLELKKTQFKAFVNLPIDQPFQMLNLLKFKQHVNNNAMTGAEQYQQYLKAASPFTQKANAKIIFYGQPMFNLIGPQQLEWDKILIVEYSTKNDFIQMITTPGYPAELRKSALADSRLIVCAKA